MYVKTDPLTLYLHTAARHFLKSWLQAASSESPFNLQEENTKLYFLYQRTPNTQRVNSKCNLSSISHISLKSIITEALTRKSFLCIVWGLWYKMSPLNTEDQDYSTGFGTLTLPLSLPLIVRHTEKIPSCFEDFNIFRTAAQMQLKFFIKNFDQYDFLLPPTNRVLSGLRSKPRLSITFLGNSLRISSPSFNTSKMMKYYSNLHNNTVSKLKTTRNSDERWLFPPHLCWNSQLLGFSWWLIQRKTWCTIYPGHLVRLRDVNQHGSLDMHQFTPQSHTESWGTCLYWGEAVSQNNYKRQRL